MCTQKIVCRVEHKAYLQEMLDELEQSTLKVILIPASIQCNEGAMIRYVVETNPSWYRDLLRMYPRTRRKRKQRYTDSKITREQVVSTLRQLLRNGSTSQIAAVLCAIAEERFLNDLVPF